MIQSQKKYILALLALILLAGPFLLSHSISKRSTNVIVPTIVAPIAPTTTPPEIVHGDISKKQVIFTFDGGSGVQSADAILKTLKKHGVRGTFFLTGKFVENNPALVQKIFTEGNEIFNHTYDHPYLSKISADQITGELDAMNQALLVVLGTIPGHELSSYSTKPYFRAPYGDRNRSVLATAARTGYQSIYWTVDADDWEESTGMTSVQVEDKILSNLSPGTIYLMHIGDTITGSILDDVFTKIEAQGYRIVSLTQGL
jgi:peptidoglycan/xylan/chitin deacetylase (PgdA/CDA1 family)